MSDYVIDQPAGLGDIFFTQGVGIHFHNQGHTVHHPVTHPMWDGGACQVDTPINLVPRSVFDVPPNSKIVDLSHQPMSSKCGTMTSKYEGLGLDFKKWRENFNFHRIVEREEALRSELGLQEGEPFILKNIYYSVSKPMYGVPESIPSDYDGKIIEMNPSRIGGRVFDWCWVFENAEQIHTVDTCIQYIIDKLDVKATRLVIHPRNVKWTKCAVGKLWEQPWEWVDYEVDRHKELAPQEFWG